MDIYLNYGKDVRNSSGIPEGISNNETVIVDTTYTIDGFSNFVAVMIPKHSKGKYDKEKTNFEFQYWTEGEFYPWYEAIYYSMFAN